jgi:hypothetical protein
MDYDFLYAFGSHDGTADRMIMRETVKFLFMSTESIRIL